MKKECGLPRAFGPRNDEGGNASRFLFRHDGMPARARNNAPNLQYFVITSAARQSIGLHLRDVLFALTAQWRCRFRSTGL
ncbi:MAG: hypothetical protein LBO00_01400 [Zoogloeaceae bacterium]|nr:hypothetical protein [Zoogloeaceae bacterium]